MEKNNINNLNRLLGESKKYSLLFDYTDEKGDIDDSWYTGDFKTVYNQIEKGCIGLLSKVLNN